MNGRVVIIDDSLTVRMDLKDAFREAGFDAEVCACAADARQVLEAQSPALIVLDVMLPDADGVEFLEELRGRPATAPTPVMLLSAGTEVKDRVRGLTRGADEYIGKPYETAYVVARARTLLRRQDRPTDAAPTILVVDDSSTYREELGARLQVAGYHVIAAASGEEGLREAADSRPDAVIVDGLMPNMDGTTVVSRIRLDPGLHATPCLLLTASEGVAGEVVALDSGADAYVRKSERADVVLARLSGMLRAAEDSRDRGHVASLLAPKRILAVDDSVTYLEEIAEQLRSEGYEVIKASSGEEALELLAVEPVDCVLLDLVMPGMSGTETCHRAKASPVLRSTPLIMLTARDEPQALIEGMNAGADDYVAKSADFDVIKARLRAQLRRKQLEDENRQVRDEMLRMDAETRVAREKAEARATLLRELEVKNRELELLNEELQMFAYSVSHDLRQPLRSVDGFSHVLVRECAEQLDDNARHCVERIRAGAERMGRLIDGLLVLSRVTLQELRRVPLRVDLLARKVLTRLEESEPQRHLDVRLAEPMEGTGDEKLVESILENLIGNAWKFTGRCARGRIEVGAWAQDAATVFFVRDNGAGFDMDYADKLFAPFQRLHSEREFSGTGIGLATTQRIVHRHGGKIWAESESGAGATFYFTLSPDAEVEP